MTNITKTITSLENNPHLNWKTIFGTYILLRLLLVVFLIYGSWNGQDLLCYTADCKGHWNNVNHMINGNNPYEMWRQAGNYNQDEIYSLPLNLRVDFPPILYVILSMFAFLWKNIWAMMGVFFLFDFLNLCFIYKLAKFKNISSLLYIFAPSIFRGLLFAEDELLVTFLLASIYLLQIKRYSLSTMMLALSVGIRIFPIVLFPVLLISMGLFKEKKGEFTPSIDYSLILKQTAVLVLTLALCHTVYYPDWYMTYEFRTFHYTLVDGGFGIWETVSTQYYPLLMVTAFILFYGFYFMRGWDIKTGYFIGSLIFISIYPRFSVDHFIFLIPLFLIWTKFSLVDILLWVFMSIVVCLEFLSLPTIGLISYPVASTLLFLVVVGFYLAWGMSDD